MDHCGKLINGLDMRVIIRIFCNVGLLNLWAALSETRKWLANESRSCATDKDALRDVPFKRGGD